jgi:hypothetical protein
MGLELLSRYDRSIAPPCKTVSLASLTSGTYPVTGAAAEKLFNAAEQAPSGTDGLLLCVHPVGNAADDNYLMPLGLGGSGRNSCRFDYVLFTGSTVDLSKVTIFEEV